MTVKDSYNTVARGRRQIIMDMESTGLVDARMVSLALLEMVDGKLTGKQLDLFFNPEKIMDDAVIAIHHITNEMAASQPLFASKAQAIRDFIGDSQVVITCRTADGMTLDIAILNDELQRAGQKEVPADQWLNVRRWSEEMFGNQQARLDAVCDRYNVSRAQRDAEGHGALLDAQLLAEVYPRLFADYTKFAASKSVNKNNPPMP